MGNGDKLTPSEIPAALGEIPTSHLFRFRYLPKADRTILGAMKLGALFVIAFWSGPSMLSFQRLKSALCEIDPEGPLELVVMDIDGCPDFKDLAEFAHYSRGAGETAWIAIGSVVASVSLYFSPNALERNTLQLIQDSLS